MPDTTELAIPAAAADAWFSCGCGEDCGRSGFQSYALPIVVAAELRRLVGAHSNPGDWGGVRYVDLLARAEELDHEAEGA
jgi:hypothetical protein